MCVNKSMLQSVFSEESLCCSLGENKCTNALVKSSHGKKTKQKILWLFLNKKKKSVFFLPPFPSVRGFSSVPPDKQACLSVSGDKIMITALSAVERSVLCPITGCRGSGGLKNKKVPNHKIMTQIFQNGQLQAVCISNSEE